MANSDRDRADARDARDLRRGQLERRLRRRTAQAHEEGQPQLVPESTVFFEHPEAHPRQGTGCGGLWGGYII